MPFRPARKKNKKENVPVVTHGYLSCNTEKILLVLDVVEPLEQVVEMVLL